MSTHTVFRRFSFPKSFRFLPFYPFWSAIQHQRSQFVLFFFFYTDRLLLRALHRTPLLVHNMWLGAECGRQFFSIIHPHTYTTADWPSPNLCYPLPSSFRQYLVKVTLQYDCKAIQYYSQVRVSPLPPMAQEPLMVGGLLIIKALRWHSNTPHSVGLLWTSDQPVAETSTWQQKTITRDRLHAPDGIRIRNPSKRAAANPRLRPRGRWYRQGPVPQFLKYKIG